MTDISIEELIERLNLLEATMNALENYSRNKEATA